MPKYLWLNLTDLSEKAMTTPLVGSPINLMIRTNLGDYRLPGAYSKIKGKLDESFIVIECTDDDRVKAILAALTIIAKRKIGRPVRSRVTAKPPGVKHWRFVG